MEFNSFNYIMIIIGLSVALLGLATIFNPNLARWINAPGGPRLKGFIALIVGIIISIIGFVVYVPGA
jgi:hypothetical protein